MKLVEIKDRAVWDRFQASQPWSQFTQSWAWGEFRVAQGSPVRRFALVDDGGMWVVAAQFEYRKRRFGLGYWYATRGPVFSSHFPEVKRKAALIAILEQLDRQHLQRSFFWRMEPLTEIGHPEGLMPMRLRRSPALSPASTLLIDLTQDRDAILAAMHHKTRYNIGLAARRGVTTRIATGPSDINTFCDLLEETATRDEFVAHGRAYIRATIEALSREGMARIRLAEHGGKILAASLEILYGDTVTYLHGASSSIARDLMAPYALHWDAITQAQRDGAQFYDFWGLNPESKASFSYKPSWEGITRFKLGFGGRRVNLYGTWDLPAISPLYVLAFPRNMWRD